MTSWEARIRTRRGGFELDAELSGPPGLLVLVGPNGGGKTSLVRALLGAIPVEQGRFVVGDRVLADTTRGIHLPIPDRRLGYVPQGHGLFPHLSVVDNVGFGLSTGPRRLSRTERRTQARELLFELGCGELADRSTRDLSGGEQQRVALARALIVEPALLLLDEPLAALDVQTRRSVRRFLGQRLHQRAIPTLLVTHDLRDAVALDAPVAVLEAGSVVQQGAVDDLRASPATAYVEALVDEALNCT